MKDGLLVSEYDALSLEGKVQYYKELETTRTKFQFDLGHYIHLIYMAVWGGKEDFNKLVMGDENTPVPEEKKKEIKERMAFLAQVQAWKRYILKGKIKRSSRID
ncbi:hypothetical protein [Rufibacter sp. LB8]|uniref:hypothetical protein n=1 Tax=Rufibacter sp. LB8 TaxID=2777781 RepID=UPI00178C7AC6|nr:hypothetical protein [Rufibacter sp. LB8]